MEIINSTWFEGKVTYQKENGQGMLKKTSELYVVDALSFSEAEKRLEEYASSYSMKDAEVMALKRADYGEVIFTGKIDDDRWYKVKLAYITLNEKTEKETRTYISYLVQADNIDNANARIKEMMKDSISDYAIETIQETKFMDVIEHED